MIGDGRSDGESMDVLVVDQSSSVGVGIHVRVKRSQMAQSALVDVTNRLKPATGKRLEIADEVRAPITTPDYPNING